MKFGIVSFFVGLIFSLGLAASGMTDPQRVLGFLDVTGSWDPSLMFVMGSAIPIYFAFWKWYHRRDKPLLGVNSHIPSLRKIDKQLILGSAIFGVGWGYAGICPGPAIASIGALSVGAIVFVVGLFIGSRIESALVPK